MAIDLITPLALYELMATMYNRTNVYITKPLSDTNTKEIVKNSKLIDAIIVVPIKPKTNEKWKYVIYSGYTKDDDNVDANLSTTLNLEQVDENISFHRINLFEPDLTSGIEDTIDVTKGEIYTVIIDESSNDPSAVEYADDAVGMEAGWDNWKGHPLFKDIRPCRLNRVTGEVKDFIQNENRDYTDDNVAVTKEDGVDIVIEFPRRIGLRFVKVDSKLHISITTKPKLKGFSYKAFENYLTNTQGDTLYISAYPASESNGNYVSNIGAINTRCNKDQINQIESYINRKSVKGLNGFNFHTLTLLQCLYLLIFKTRKRVYDEQSTLLTVEDNSTTNKVTDVNNILPTGYNNNAPLVNGIYGPNTGSSGNWELFTFLGIENLWEDKTPTILLGPSVDMTGTNEYFLYDEKLHDGRVKETTGNVDYGFLPINGPSAEAKISEHYNSRYTLYKDTDSKVGISANDGIFGYRDFGQYGLTTGKVYLTFILNKRGR